ncbi:galactoside alpha-(1,2)-fucosyltransferase 2-like [Paramacrobiotus metropolitanus]|uniref:galactoside alpha-(1,2)-fucosyltransferase 2-like n=1 Tax=Paramacrobiotus metropolitanus TaxID=2943436 RepID=UPI002445C23D|nr:galactoside alpha-(1,2)-fucosyltransferase 2-like [Paramacrobiotus metropolitanus]
MAEQVDEYINIPLINPNDSSNESGDEDSYNAASSTRVTADKKKSVRIHNGSSVRRDKSPPLTDVQIAVADSSSPCCRNSFLHNNWISVFLLSTILAWIVWMGARELFKHWENVADLPAIKPALAHCPQLEDGRNIDPILIAINRGGRDHLLDLQDCSLDISHKLTIRRLTLRAQQKQNRISNYTIPYSKHLKTHSYLVPKLLESRPAKGLGNWMFALAAVYGIARQHQWQWNPAFPGSSQGIPLVHERKHYFREFSIETAENSTVYQELKTKGFAMYDPIVTKINTLYHNVSISLDGYLQAYRYFDLYREDIKQLFLFNVEIFFTAISLISNLLDDYLKRTPSTKNWKNLPNLVGIHVRRGDILEERYRAEGHEPATEAYLLRATLHMEMAYAPALFIIVTNDVIYCRKVFKGDSFLFVEHQTEDVDMAMLTLMDYIVLSVGSFGWWAAYLSDAREVYYYKYWPRNGTQMHKELVPEDYFLQSWTAFE